MIDIRDAKFYVCEDETAFHHDLTTLDFDTAFRQGTEIAASGAGVHMIYAEDASQSQLTQLASSGIRARLVPTG